MTNTFFLLILETRVMPDVREIPDDIESIASTAEDDHQVELLLAGFRACAKEAIRFLLEDEGLAPDHALPVGLQEHLDRRQNHLAGILQNDSGIDVEASFCDSTADDLSLVANDISDSGNFTVKNSFSNASTSNIPQNISCDYLMADSCVRDTDSMDSVNQNSSRKTNSVSDIDCHCEISSTADVVLPPTSSIIHDYQMNEIFSKDSKDT